MQRISRLFTFLNHLCCIGFLQSRFFSVLVDFDDFFFFNERLVDFVNEKLAHIFIHIVRQVEYPQMTLNFNHISFPLALAFLVVCYFHGVSKKKVYDLISRPIRQQ